MRLFKNGPASLILTNAYGAVHKVCHAQGGGEGQRFVTGGGGRVSPA
jgi:hypothetical protein